MEDLKLDEKSCTEIIMNSVHVGQRKGAYSIKDASVLYKVLLFLKNETKPKDLPDLDKKTSFDTLIKAIVIANSKGSYSIEEAAIIEKTVTELQRLDLASSPEKPEEEPTGNGKEKITDL